MSKDEILINIWSISSIYVAQYVLYSNIIMVYLKLNKLCLCIVEPNTAMKTERNGGKLSMGVSLPLLMKFEEA